MSLSYQKIQEQAATIQQLQRELVKLKTQLGEALGGPRRRARYPVDASRGEGGRVIHPCVGCHRVGEIRARGLCGPCYARWRRLQLVT